MSEKSVMFSPRRLGHANLFVGELERSSEFYTKVCGLSEVFREPPIKAIFLSNGSSHHDVALIEISARARKAGDGSSLISEKRGMRPGLNHFGWEMENELVLLEAYERALESGLPIHRTADHQVSHSVYLFDPEGNYHEFYADAAKDWREVWRDGNTEVLTVKWTPQTAERSTAARYADNPYLVPNPEGIIPSRQVGHGVLVAQDYEGLVNFYVDVAGLEIAHAGADGSYTVFTGPLDRHDLVILPLTEGRVPGMHHVGFELKSEEEVEAAEAAVRAKGIEPEASIDSSTKRSFFLLDPGRAATGILCVEGWGLGGGVGGGCGVSVVGDEFTSQHIYNPSRDLCVTADHASGAI